MAKITKQKDAVCIDCGKEIKINVLASLKTARCEDCKGGSRKAKIEPASDGQETAYGESMVGPRIDGPPNPALARLACPYHPEKTMDVVGVIKNDHWGDIVSMQCRVKGCYTLVQISEQSRKMGPYRTTVDGTSFEPDDLIQHVREGHMDDWCAEHGVEQRHTKGL